MKDPGKEVGLFILNVCHNLLQSYERRRKRGDTFLSVADDARLDYWRQKDVAGRLLTVTFTYFNM